MMSKVLLILEEFKILRFRTSYAGIENPPEDLKKSHDIVKKYPHEIESHSDKGVDIKVTSQDYDAIVREHEKLGIDYLIDD